jgi:hypothetical protein
MTKENPTVVEVLEEFVADIQALGGKRGEDVAQQHITEDMLWPDIWETYQHAKQALERHHAPPPAAAPLQGGEPTDRKLSLVLAGLRLLQDTLQDDLDWGCEIGYWSKDTPPTFEEIEALCEGLNCGPLAVPGQHQLEIYMEGGCLLDVTGLPEGWTYTLHDYDDDPDSKDQEEET